MIHIVSVKSSNFRCSYYIMIIRTHTHEGRVWLVTHRLVHTTIVAPIRLRLQFKQIDNLSLGVRQTPAEQALSLVGKLIKCVYCNSSPMASFVSLHSLTLESPDPSLSQWML